MNIICKTHTLQNLIKTLSKIGKKEDYTIMFEATKSNKLTTTVSNSVISLQTYIDADVKEENVCAIPGEKFSSVISKLQEYETAITINETQVDIVSGNSKVKLALKSTNALAEKYEIDKIDEKATDTILMPSATLSDMLKVVHTAVLSDLSKPALTGILLNMQNNNVEAVATNGIRLALIKEELNSDVNKKIIIPIETVKTLLQLLPQAGDVKIKTHIKNPTKVFFEFGNIKLHSSLLYGEFLDYTKLFYTPSTTVVIDKEKLTDAIALVSTIAGSMPICLDMKDNTFNVSSNSSEGESHIDFEVIKNGNDLKIYFNSELLLKAINSTKSDEINLSFGTNISPCIVIAENQKHIILPVNVRN